MGQIELTVVSVLLGLLAGLLYALGPKMKSKTVNKTK